MIRKLLGSLAALTFSASLYAAPVTIDFDDLSDGDSVGSNYASQGVTFVDAVIDTANGSLPGGSGPNAISHLTSIYQPQPLDPIEAIFSTAVSSVSLTGIDVGDAGFVLTAFDSSNNQVATDRVFGSDWGIGEYYTLTLTGLDIVRITFSQVGYVYYDGIVFDNLTFEPVAAVPLPAAAWLFGSALLGFVGFGTRKRV
jgi:hypothetical protein